MSKRFILLTGVATMLLVGGSFGLFVIPGESLSGWQIAQVAAPPGQQQQQKSTPAPAPSGSPTTTAPSTAQRAQAETAGPGWALNCKSEVDAKALDCTLSQAVATQRRELLASVTFVFPAAPGKPTMNIQLPLGVLLTEGASVRVDENAPQKLAYKACDRSGCYLEAPVSPELLTMLRRGKQLSIEFKNLANNAITVPVSLDRFGDAYGKIPST
jgi:invasion protein IalB